MIYSLKFKPLIIVLDGKCFNATLHLHTIAISSSLTEEMVRLKRNHAVENILLDLF